MKTKALISSMALAMSMSMTNAGLIEFDGSSDVIDFPDVIGNLVLDVPGTIDLSLTGGLLPGRELRLAQTSRVTFTALVSESDWEDVFVTVGGQLYDGIDNGNSVSGIYGPGLLDFSFIAGATGETVANGHNLDNYLASLGRGSLPHFGLAAVDRAPVETWLIGLQDDGQTIDFDFDDHVLKIEVEPVEVPEPAAAALLGIGLIGIGLTRLARQSGSRQ